jgi:hypothetical protein
VRYSRRKRQDKHQKNKVKRLGLLTHGSKQLKAEFQPFRLQFYDSVRRMKPEVANKGAGCKHSTLV